MVTLVNELLENAPSPIVVTLSGMVTLVNELLENASSPITLTTCPLNELGIETAFSKSGFFIVFKC